MYRGREANDTSGLLDRLAFAKRPPDGPPDISFRDNGMHWEYLDAGGISLQLVSLPATVAALTVVAKRWQCRALSSWNPLRRGAPFRTQRGVLLGKSHRLVAL